MLQFSKWPHLISNAGIKSKITIMNSFVHVLCNCLVYLINFRFYYPFTCTPNRKFNLKQGRVQIPEKFKLVALQVHESSQIANSITIKYKLWGVEINKYEK